MCRIIKMFITKRKRTKVIKTLEITYVYEVAYQNIPLQASHFIGRKSKQKAIVLKSRKM